MNDKYNRMLDLLDFPVEQPTTIPEPIIDQALEGVKFWQESARKTKRLNDLVTAFKEGSI